MPRTVVTLVVDTWTPMATVPVILTVHQEGLTGKLLLNTVTSDDAQSLVVSKGRAGAQFVNNSITESTWAKATGEGWRLAVDIDT